MHKHLCLNEFCTNLDVWRQHMVENGMCEFAMDVAKNPANPNQQPLPLSGKISGRIPHDHLNCLGHVSPAWWLIWILSCFKHLIGRSKWHYTCPTGRGNCRVPETMSSRFLRCHEATDKPRQSHYRPCLLGPAWALQGIEDSLWVLRKIMFNVRRKWMTN